MLNFLVKSSSVWIKDRLFNSIKTRIIFYTFILFVMSILILSFYASSSLRKDMQKTFEEQQFAAASIYAQQIEEGLKIRIEALEETVKSIEKSMPKNHEKMQDFLQNRVVLKKLFNAAIFIVDTNGLAIAGVPESLGMIGVNYADRDYVINAFKNKQMSVGSIVQGKVLYKPNFSIAVPIKNLDDNIIGLLVGTTSLEMDGFLNGFSDVGYGKNGNYFLVSPKERLIVASSNKNRVMEKLPTRGIIPAIDRFIDGYKGSAIYTNQYGAEMLTSAKRIPIVDWVIAISIPTKDAFSPILAMQKRMVTATLIMTFIIGFLFWLILYRQLHPLTRAIQLISSMIQTNNQSIEPLPIKNPDEIGKLFGNFNTLIGRLEKQKTSLKENEMYLNALIEAIPDAIFLKNAHGNWLITNQPAKELFQLSGLEWQGKTDIELANLHPAFYDAHNACIKSDDEVWDNGKLTFFSEKRYTKEGDERDYEVRKVPIFDNVKERLALVVIGRDITEFKKIDTKLRLAASVFTAAKEGITITDKEGFIIDVNSAFTQITGYSKEEALGKKPAILSSGHHDKAFYENMWKSLLENDGWSGEIWNRRKNGEIYPEILSISAARNSVGDLEHYVALFFDISERKEHEAKLEYIAYYDALTGLPRRGLLTKILREKMDKAQKENTKILVLLIDIDNFKGINDKYGHAMGDTLLVSLAQKIQLLLKEGDVFGRLSGDEFLVITQENEDYNTQIRTLEELLLHIATPLYIENHILHVTASIGIVSYPQSEEVDADQILRQANQSMYQAKLHGKNCYQVHNCELEHKTREEHDKLEDIAHALDEGDFVLYYQPKVNMRTGEVIGAEALIRWDHPEKGILPPSSFLPLIEDHPLSITMGEWVINTALNQMSVWKRAGFDIKVSVNVGARQLQNENFTQNLRLLLSKYPTILPFHLELEILETSALENIKNMASIIQECYQMGVSFALDDFGTGYSALTYLKELPVKVLKIDQSFVRDMLNDPNDLSILEGIIGLSVAFRREVIAEGVETIAQGKMLIQLGCDLAQGYCIARPMPAGELLFWIVKWKNNSIWQKTIPMHRDEYPLLFAGVEHYAWIIKLKKYITEEETYFPEMDEHQCQLGQWMQRDGLKQYGVLAFSDISSLHVKIHLLALQLVALKNAGKQSDALELLEILHELRDTLLQKLEELLSPITSDIES